ncbi:MAG: ATP-binding protein, partial [Bacteroidales bacterium]|nr:ATP-binding protein [Bacteroidales bacterium]
RSSTDGKRYLCFTSTATGSIVEKEWEFDTNSMYPWLDNRSFNKWFVPTGCSQPVSMLPIAEADKYDFRAPAFREMLVFLQEHQKIYPHAEFAVQTSFDFDCPLFIVCGPSCAGKTTLAEYLADHYGYYHIEASDFMYLSYYQRHGVSSIMNIGDFAEQALREQPEIVAEKILRNISLNKPVQVIITGFRSPMELEWFCHHYTGRNPIEVVYVTADEAVRYSRALLRQREGEAEDREVFIRRDIQQAAMGLEELETRLTSNNISNNGSLESFLNSFEARYGLKTCQHIKEDKSRGSAPSGKLEESILLALANKWQGREYFTTTEIAQLINQSLEDKPKSKNNVSRYFNQIFHPYYEIRLVNGRKKYRLSNTGYGKARILVDFRK